MSTSSGRNPPQCGRIKGIHEEAFGIETQGTHSSKSIHTGNWAVQQICLAQGSEDGNRVQIAIAMMNLTINKWKVLYLESWLLIGRFIQEELVKARERICETKNVSSYLWDNLRIQCLNYAKESVTLYVTQEGHIA